MKCKVIELCHELCNCLMNNNNYNFKIGFGHYSYTITCVVNSYSEIAGGCIYFKMHS